MALAPHTNNFVSDTGQVRAILPRTIGSGYTTATVTITGGNGSSAAADAIIQNGSVIGYEMTNYGSNYSINNPPTASDIPTVTITGDGTGATAIAQIGDHILSVKDTTSNTTSAVMDYSPAILSSAAMIGQMLGTKFDEMYNMLDGHLTTIEGKLDTLNGELSTHNTTLAEIKDDVDRIRYLGDTMGPGYRNRGSYVTDGIMWQSIIRDGFMLDETNKSDANISPSVSKIKEYSEKFDDAFPPENEV